MPAAQRAEMPGMEATKKCHELGVGQRAQDSSLLPSPSQLREKTFISSHMQTFFCNPALRGRRSAGRSVCK